MSGVGEFCRKPLGWHVDETYENRWSKIGNQKIKGRKWNKARNFKKRVVWSAHTVKTVWHMTLLILICPINLSHYWTSFSHRMYQSLQTSLLHFPFWTGPHAVFLMIISLSDSLIHHGNMQQFCPVTWLSLTWANRSQVIAPHSQWVRKLLKWNKLLKRNKVRPIPTWNRTFWLGIVSDHCTVKTCANDIILTAHW